MASLIARNVNPALYRVTLNGHVVDGWVFASEETGTVSFQKFPLNWVVGEPMPREVHREGRVRIEKL